MCENRTPYGVFLGGVAASRMFQPEKRQRNTQAVGSGVK
jgi:hypothetical protein